MYYKGYILSHKVQFEVKLILDETWLDDESNHIKYRPLDLKWKSCDF